MNKIKSYASLTIGDGERYIKSATKSRDKRAERARFIAGTNLHGVFQVDPVLDQWQFLPAGTGVDNALGADHVDAISHTYMHYFPPRLAP